LIAKIAAVIPEQLRPFIAEPSIGVKPSTGETTKTTDTGLFRSAIRSGHKLRISYQTECGERTERTVWPVLLGYADTQCVLIAWCELRQDFRHFRQDRIKEEEMLSETNGLRKGELRQRYYRWREANVL